MINFTLIEAYDPIVNFCDIRLINLNSDVVKWYYQMKLGEPHKLVIHFSPAFSAIDVVLSSTTFGVRMRTSNLNLAFVYFDRKIIAHGVVVVEFYSSVYKLNFEPLRYLNTFYSGSLQSFLGTPFGFEFVPISGDRQIRVTTGALNNLEAVTEAISYPFYFTFLEAGIREISGVQKTVILFGDFRDVESFYTANSSLYPYLEPGTATNFLADSRQPGATYITDYEKIENTMKFNHVYAYVDSGTGQSPNSSIVLQAGASYVNPQYPVVTIDGVNYVQVPQAPNTPVRVKVYPVNEPSSTETAGGTPAVVPDISAEVAYSRTVRYIQSFGASFFWKFKVSNPYVKLPGVPLLVTCRETIKNPDGTVAFALRLNQKVIPSTIEGDGNEVFF